MFIRMPTQPFQNPLLPYGPDPWAIFHEGFYYYMHSTRTDLTIWKARSLVHLDRAEHKTVWVAPGSGPNSRNVWSPELHHIRGCWYIYFTAEDERGINERQRMWVIQNPATDPLSGHWSEPQQIITPEDKWAIDGSIFAHKGQLYFTWSGWEGDDNHQQNIYLCRMSDPLTCVGERIRLSAPTLPWERNNRDPDPRNPRNQVIVNEGPAPLLHNERVFIIFSASGCWTDQYCLGLLCASDPTDLMNPTSWTKHTEPILQTSVENAIYAPGHNCFVKAPDGSDWILYHANSAANQGCGDHRAPFAQPVSWQDDGTPSFGIPARTGTQLVFPR